MNNLETTCISSGELDTKEIFREMFNTPLRGEVQPNVGRIQQEGKQSYFAVYKEPEFNYGTDLYQWYLTGLKAGYTSLTSQNLNRYRRFLMKLDPACYLQAISSAFYDSGTNVLIGRHHDAYRASWHVTPKRGSTLVLDLARRLDRLGKIDAALDLIYGRINSMLTDEKFEEVDLIFKDANIKSLSVDLLLGLLTSTLPARSKLHFRKKFFVMVEEEIQKRGEWENGLLAGLES